MQALLLRFARYAAEPRDSEELRLRKVIGMAVIGFSTFTYSLYGLIYLTFGERSASLVTLGGAIICVLLVVSYAFARRYELHWWLFSATAVINIAMIHFILGGFKHGGMVAIYLLIIPLVTIVADSARRGLWWAFVVIGVVIIAAFADHLFARPNNLPPGFLTVFNALNFIGFSSYLLLALFYYVWRLNVIGKQVEEERERSERLLLNILPAPIAERLKASGDSIAEHSDGVTVLFADIVGFTPLSANKTPQALVELLNRIFSEFDALADAHGLEKIKTIGDAYMAVAGLPEPWPDHAPRAARMALAMLDVTARVATETGEKLALRIGLHSGPVVAGVIGRRKFTYDLWGDTVNTASRMESHGVPGAIHCTEATALLMNGACQLQARGAIEIKGKGEMYTFLLLNPEGASDG